MCIIRLTNTFQFLFDKYFVTVTVGGLAQTWLFTHSDSDETKLLNTTFLYYTVAQFLF